MTTYEDILRLQTTAEETRLQLKERIKDKYDIGCELVAFSNTKGGDLMIGVNDKSGEVNPLSYVEVQETTSMLGNMASENVVPSILLDIENVEVDGGAIVVAHVKEGLNKPYRDNKGIVWVKNGADKRKVYDNAELAEMMTECGTLIPDLAPIPDITLDDLDADSIKAFLSNRFSTTLQKNGMVGDRLHESNVDEICSTIAKGHDLTRLFRNLRFIRTDGQLTTAAVLLFAKYTQRWLPTMTAKCISYVGNNIAGSQFRDKVDDGDMEGNLLHQFDTIMAFFKRNLRNIQTTDEFNSLGQMEIPYVSLVEFTVNALVHRSLNWTAPIRIFIFDDRIEIHSPGTLPNGLSVSDIVSGTSMPRNTFLFANAIYLLPYTGVGSGIQRAIAGGLEVQFSNNEAQHEFMITIPRKSNQAEGKGNQVEGGGIGESNQVEPKSNQVGEKSNQVGNQVKLSNKQKDIINFCNVPRSAAEIMARIGLTNQSKNRAAHIQPLVEAGYLERTNPDNPSASNQKYRKVQK